MTKHAKYNFNTWLCIVSCMLLMPLLAACEGQDEPNDPYEPESKAVSRTVLVYMVATNNLGTGGFDSADLREMEKGAAEGQLGDGRLIAYHASPKGIVLKEITSTGIDTLKVYSDDALSVSVERMRQVIADVKEMSPSDEYGLVLWSHATGWLQDGVQEDIPENRLRSFGADGLTSSKKMNITSMAYALEDAGLSFIYFDCCYMGSVETLYELRKCAPYLVASPAEVPSNGMPYDLNLKHFFDMSKPLEEALIDAARTTFDDYNTGFVKGDCPCTMSVVRSDKLEALAQKTKELYLAAEYTYNPPYDPEKDEKYYQKFKVSGRCYYYDFDQYVESLCSYARLVTEWRNALSDAVIYADATPYVWNTPIKRYCGLSTFIAETKSLLTTSNYNTLSWYDDVAAYLYK